MKLRKAIAFIQIVCIVFLNVWNLRFAKADDGDIFGTNIEPNVLIVLDTSGSMGDADGTDDGKIDTNIAYIAGTTYASAGYNSTRVYRKQGSSYNTYANSVAAIDLSDNKLEATVEAALNTSGFWSGKISGSSVQLFVGNYLNYLFASCSNCAQEDKMDAAKRLVNDLVNNVEGVRFGVMRFVNNEIFTSTGGGGIVAQVGTAPATIVSAVNAIDEVGWTPLGRQMDDVGRYYKGQTLRNGQTYSSPIQYSCQPNFAIVISDGLWTDTSPVVDPKTEATNRLTQDHSTTFAGTQNVIVHTIALDLDPDNAAEKTALSDLQTMAKNGGGSYFTASNAAQLEVALQDAISQILAASFSFANPVIPTTGTTGSTRAYLAAFQSNPSRPFWKGYLKAYTRDSNGLIPVDAQGLPTGTPVWDSGTQLSLKTASSRNIKTVVSGSLQDFTTSNVTATLLGVNSSPFPLNASDATDARNKVVAFIRGSTDYNDDDADNDSSEERPWKLGDIFHSTPVLVSPPFLPSADSTYATFKTAQASRTMVILAGSNDGMLHAFTESNGEESWAFIPPNLLGDLKNLTVLSGTRDYFVDASPIVADVKTGGTWKTIAVFGQRRGGKYYYALDITNTTSPQYLWGFTDSKLGEAWSDPAIGKVKMADGTDKWVAFIGGGFDSSHSNYTSGNNVSEAFFAIDLSNGAKLWEYYNSSSSDDRQYMNFSFAANPTAVDLNNDGYIDKVYIGDVGGQVWKFDVAPTGGATLSGSLINNWMGKRLFAAASSQANPPAAGEYYPAQAIYVPPTLAYDANGSLWIFFGTGDRFHPNNTSSNRFYGIKENTGMTNGSALTESSLANLSSGSGTVSQGWYIPLASNEKVLASADVFSSVAFFTTFTPVTAAICGTGGGDAKLYSVNMSTGDAALDLVNGTVLTPGQSALAAARSIGTGIPSKPIVNMSQSGNKATPYVITGTTSQQITNTQVPQVTVKRLIGWREVF